MSKIAINCKTKADAIEHLAELDGQECKWCTGKSLLSATCWFKYGEKTCYAVTGKSVSFGSKRYYESIGYKVKQYKPKDKMQAIMDNIDAGVKAGAAKLSA